MELHALGRAKNVKKFLISATLIAATTAALAGAFVSKAHAKTDDHDHPDRLEFLPGTLVVSRSVYVGDASTVTLGETLPAGCVAGNVALPLLAGGSTTVAVSCAAATADGTFPGVFNNDTPDASFGVTSPIFLDNITTDGEQLGTLDLPSDQIVTSFSSKSELALNLSLDRKSITFVGYRGGTGFVTAPNQLDVSNSNTPGVVDPSNPVVSQYYRAVAEVDAGGCKLPMGMLTVVTTAARRSRLTRRITWAETTTTGASRKASSPRRR
jgi:hypothetical protein